MSIGIPAVSPSTLIDSWEKDSYPEYIGGMYGSELNWTIYLKENTLERQQQMRERISSQYNLTFQGCTYSHKELSDVKYQIVQNYVATGSGIRSVSIECHQWSEGITEPRVLVILEDSVKYDFWSTEFSKLYGSKVVTAVYDAVSGYIIPAQPVESEGTKVAQPHNISVKSAEIKKNKLVIRWKKSDGVSKYQVQIFRGKKKVTTISTKKLTCKYSIKKKKSGKYYVRVRAYGKDAGRWGQWSKKIKAK